MIIEEVIKLRSGKNKLFSQKCGFWGRMMLGRRLGRRRKSYGRFFFFFKSVFILLCGIPYVREKHAVI
jgi:hypothetical protein